MTEELWKPVAGYEGLYDVSTLGRVRSHDRIVNRANGTARWPGKVLKRQKGSKGHYLVNLWNEEGQKTKFIHRLVAETFLPNPKGFPVVRHLNDVKEDNTLENLAWGTHSDNMQDAIRNGRIPPVVLKETCYKGHPLAGDNLYINPVGSRVCIACKKAMQEKNANRQRRERTQRGLPAGDPRHGTLNGYSNYGCKCVLCSEEASRRAKERRKRGKSETKSGE